MTAAGLAGLGWVVAGVLLLASGAGLALRASAYASGLLFAAAGSALVLAGLAPGGAGTAAVVAALILLTAATATYPRCTRDPARALVLTGVLLGTPGLTWYLADAGGGLGPGEVGWICFALVAIGGSHLWWRLETADADTANALLWVVSTAGVTSFLAGVLALTRTPEVLAAAAHAGLGLVGVAALLGVDRRSVLDGRWLASRVAAWFFAVACAFAVATLALTLLAWWSGSTPGLVATAIVAVACGTAWKPLLVVAHRVSDGILFGFRPDALTAAQRVAVGIGDDPAAAVRAIQEGLVLPYAALALEGEEPLEVGVPTARRRVFPIDLDDEHIGDLVVGIRAGDLGLTQDDERVLTLALPILVQTIRARALVAGLQRARMAGASAREEERRRLRRDLHDGLGPRLTGIAFTADAARLAASRGSTEPMLDRIRREAETALDEIRELVDGLRPPALDELGLVGAIKLRTDVPGGLPVEVVAGSLPALPAAVEVAAYRIVVEALTNVVRHSGGTRATVVLREVEGHLVVSVRDDGASRGSWVPGTGLTSMRERATELGGTLTHESVAAGGTVTAFLPLATPGTTDEPDGGPRRADPDARGAGAATTTPVGGAPVRGRIAGPGGPPAPAGPTASV